MRFVEWIMKNQLWIAMVLASAISLSLEVRQREETERQLQALQAETAQLRPLRPLHLLLESLEDSGIRLSWGIQLAPPQDRALEGCASGEPAGSHATTDSQVQQ